MMEMPDKCQLVKFEMSEVPFHGSRIHGGLHDVKLSHRENQVVEAIDARLY